MADFRKLALLLIVLVAFVVPLAAQVTTVFPVLPDKFIGGGLGFQNSAVPKASGWFSTCVKTLDRVYGCASTDYAAGVTSARAEAFPAIAKVYGCYLLGKTGAGASTGGNGGIGGSFDLGGVAACPIPEKILKIPNLVAVFSGSWQKNDVNQFDGTAAGFRAFASQTIWRFGFGRTW
jgi:hypothetical protein